MKTINATITYDAKRERLICEYDNGFVESIPWSEPITAASDSHGIASQFGSAVAVDHDRHCVHATYDVCETDDESQENSVAEATRDADEAVFGIDRSQK